jgi:hypothetical protein
MKFQVAWKEGYSIFYIPILFCSEKAAQKWMDKSPHNPDVFIIERVE